MKTTVKVLKVDQVISKKGNPLLICMVQENGNPIPMKILVYQKALVSRPCVVGQEVTLYTDVDSQLNGTLSLTWAV